MRNMAKTKFIRGEKVKIKSCPFKEDLVGAKGTIVRVRVDDKGIAYYKIRVGKLYVPMYALDEHLEKISK